MKSIVMATVLAAGMVVAGTANAAGEAELAQKSGCMTCHAVDTKKMGPAFKDIGAKFKGKADAQKNLVTALSTGKGHPQQKAPEADLNTLVKWILAM
jgi:cytochrome c